MTTKPYMPVTVKKGEDLLNQTMELCYQNWWKIEQIYAIWAAKNDTHPKALFTLQQLYHAQDGYSQAALCEKLQFPKQTLSSILNKLEQDDLVTRQTHPKDRRNKLVKLTDKGLAEVRPVMERLHQAELEAYSELTIHERTQLLLLITKLSNALERSFLKTN